MRFGTWREQASSFLVELVFGCIVIIAFLLFIKVKAEAEAQHLYSPALFYQIDPD